MKISTTNTTIRKSFPIVGMHCASCAKLIERKLINTKGVINASVNYGSEQALVETDSSVTNEQIAKSVEEAGYKAIIQNGKTAGELKVEEKKKELRNLKKKVIVSGILSVLIFVGSFPEWFIFLPGLFSIFFILLLLTTPVQFWAGWEFYPATWSGLRNRTASMDSLISIGTTAAYAYSVYSIFFGGHMYFDTA